MLCCLLGCLLCLFACSVLTPCCALPFARAVYRGRTPSAVSPPASSTRGELTSSIREPQVRAEQEREYMQKQGTYLNGLQSHMLGDSEPDSLATRIFKKCAFVADTFSRNRHAAL